MRPLAGFWDAHAIVRRCRARSPHGQIDLRHGDAGVPSERHPGLADRDTPGGEPFAVDDLDHPIHSWRGLSAVWVWLACGKSGWAPLLTVPARRGGLCCDGEDGRREEFGLCDRNFANMAVSIRNRRSSDSPHNLSLQRCRLACHIPEYALQNSQID